MIVAMYELDEVCAKAVPHGPLLVRMLVSVIRFDEFSA
jgi:hypothetical protein